MAASKHLEKLILRFSEVESSLASDSAARRDHLAVAGRAAVVVMTRPLELPSEVAKAFVEDMRAYFEEENPIKRDEIAVLQMHSLQKYWPGKLRLSDVKALFEQMHDRLDD